LFGQAVGVQREFSGWMSKPWRMVTLHIGAWASLGVQWWGREISSPGGLTILDWTCLIVVLGCLQTMAVRLKRILRALEAKNSKPPTS
jgi:hypothetical protein